MFENVHWVFMNWKLYLGLNVMVVLGLLASYVLAYEKVNPFVFNFIQICVLFICLIHGNYLARIDAIKGSNNITGPNKNICMSVVFDYLGLADRVNYLHFMADGVKLAKSKYNVSLVANVDTVADTLKLQGLFLVFVEGHVLLVADGSIVADSEITPVDKEIVSVYKLESNSGH